MWLRTLTEALLVKTHDYLVAKGDCDRNSTQVFIEFTGTNDFRGSRLNYQFRVRDTFTNDTDLFWLALDLANGAVWLSNNYNRISPIRQLHDKPATR